MAPLLPVLKDQDTAAGSDVHKAAVRHAAEQVFRRLALLLPAHFGACRLPLVIISEGNFEISLQRATWQHDFGRLSDPGLLLPPPGVHKFNAISGKQAN